LLQDDATAAVPVAAAEATTTTTSSNGTLTNGILRARGGGGLSNKWELTPVSLLIRTLSYMDNDTLMIMCLVCTQIRDIIWTGQGMETKLVRIFELSAPEKKNEDSRRSIRRFVSNMNQYFQNVTKTRILQGFQHWKVREMKEFNNNKGFVLDRELTRLIQNIRMVGIVSLDMSSPVSIACEYGGLHRAISFMVPNLQQLDLSHTMMSASILEEFAARCPRLQIIRWNNNREQTLKRLSSGNLYTRLHHISDDNLQSMNNLKELYLDNWCLDSYFSFYMNDNDDDDDDDDNGVTQLKPCQTVITIQIYSCSTIYRTNHWNGYRFETHITNTPTIEK